MVHVVQYIVCACMGERKARRVWLEATNQFTSDTTTHHELECSVLGGEGEWKLECMSANCGFPLRTKLNASQPCTLDRATVARNTSELHNIPVNVLTRQSRNQCFAMAIPLLYAAAERDCGGDSDTPPSPFPERHTYVAARVAVNGFFLCKPGIGCCSHLIEFQY